MANLSIREAVKHFDVSRPTLTKALKSGKVTGVQDGQGTWSIDTSELARVYRPRPMEVDKVDKAPPVNLSTVNTPLAAEFEALRERLAAAEQRAAVAEERARHLDDLKEDRDRWRQQATALLADLRPAAPTTPPPDPAPRHRWWPWRSTPKGD